MFKLDKHCALVIVDMQKDFMPGGSLPIPGGNNIVPVINEYVGMFLSKNSTIVFSRDWHPIDHVSFKENGGPWPAHCVVGTVGSEYADKLIVPFNAFQIVKAYTKEKDTYSAFEDTGLANTLSYKGIDTVFVCGVASEYCVAATINDSIKNGFKTNVLMDAVKPAVDDGTFEFITSVIDINVVKNISNII